MPIPRYSLHRLRHWIALPIGFALFWHDTWLPGPESIMSQGSQVAGFSTDYLIDLVTRFINWQMIGAVFVLFIAWLFLSQWIRITVFVVAILVWLNVLTLAGPSFSLWPAGQPTTTVTTTGVMPQRLSQPRVALRWSVICQRKLHRRQRQISIPG